MKNNLRKLTAILLSLLMLFTVLAGCSKQPAEKESAEAPSEEGEQITLRFFSALPDRTSGLGLLEERMLEIYQKDHPNVTIETEYLQDEPYKVKLQTYMQSNNMPDVWQQFGYGALLDPVSKGNFAMELNPSDYADWGFFPRCAGDLYGGWQADWPAAERRL